MRGIVMAGSAAVLAVLGCSSSSSPTGPLTGSTTCTVTLSGAVTGSYSCLPDAMLYYSTLDSGGYLFSIPQNGSTPAILTAIAFRGRPAVGDYVNTGGSNGLINVTTATGGWAAITGTSGSYDLKITQLGAGVQDSNATVYPAVGTLTATLAAQAGTGASGTITMSVAF